MKVCSNAIKCVFKSKHLQSAQTQPSKHPQVGSVLQDAHCTRCTLHIARIAHCTLHTTYCTLHAAQVGNALKAGNLLDFEEWSTFCADFKLMDLDFTSRELILTFVWSRMRTIDTEPKQSKAKLTQLCFEDFLEALVRVATTKTLPTDGQLADTGFGDAGRRIGTASEEECAWLHLDADNTTPIRWSRIHSTPNQSNPIQFNLNPECCSYHSISSNPIQSYPIPSLSNLCQPIQSNPSPYNTIH